MPAFLDLADPSFSTRGAEVAAARQAGPLARTPYGWAVLRWREAGLMLRDRRLRQGSHSWPARHGMEGSFAEFWRRSVIGREGDAHRALRDLVTPVLSDDYVASLIPDFREVAEDLGAGLRARDRAEFQGDFALPFAGRAITRLLGMGDEGWREVAADAATLGLSMGVECKRHEARVNAAHARLAALAETLAARARADGGDDYVARLTARHGALGLDEAALIDMIVISIFGGVDTTRAQLGLGLSLFIARPDQWAALRADPSLIPQAVEEIVAMRPTTTWVTREAVERIEMADAVIEPGETVHILVNASATDPAVRDGEGFDVTRPRKRHFGFGGGAHHCIGHLIARTDMAEAWKVLARDLETVEADGPAVFLPDSGNTAPERLPIRYRLAAGAGP